MNWLSACRRVEKHLSDQRFEELLTRARRFDIELYREVLDRYEEDMKRVREGHSKKRTMGMLSRLRKEMPEVEVEEAEPLAFGTALSKPQQKRGRDEDEDKARKVFCLSHCLSRRLLRTPL